MSNIRRVTPRGPITTHLRATQDAALRLRPGSSAGTITKNTTRGIIRTSTAQRRQEQSSRVAARWA